MGETLLIIILNYMLLYIKKYDDTLVFEITYIFNLS